MARLSWPSVVGTVILAITVYLFYHTFDEVYQTSILTAGRGPVFFPRIILGGMLLFSVVVILEGVNEEPAAGLAPKSLALIVSVILLTGIYIYSIGAAGFLISTIVFTFLLPLLLGYRNLLICGAIAIIYPFVVWYVFEKVFLIILPTSPWFEAF